MRIYKGTAIIWQCKKVAERHDMCNNVGSAREVNGNPFIYIVIYYVNLLC